MKKSQITQIQHSSFHLCPISLFYHRPAISSHASAVPHVTMSLPASWKEVTKALFSRPAATAVYAVGIAVALGVMEAGRRVLLAHTPEIAAAVQESDRKILADIRFRRGE